MAKIYNPLRGTVRRFAVDNKIPREWANRVQGGRRQAANLSVAVVAGDGQFGFRSRREPKDPVSMTVGGDGQYLRKRAYVARRKKQVCRLWTRSQMAGREPVVCIEAPVKPKRSRNRRATR